jgi:hypothetical protein
LPTRFDRSILQRHLHKVSHLFRRLLLHPGSDMGVSIQRKTRGKMSQHMGQRLDVDAILQGNCGKSVPLWHNKDKSENPCVATGWRFVLILFPLKTALKWGLREGVKN